MVECADSFLGESALSIEDILLCLGEEAAGQRTVGVERDTEFAKGGQEFGILATGYWRVVALIDCGFDIAILLAIVVDSLDIAG